MKNKISTKDLVLMGVITAVLFVMAYTPLGYLNVGAVAITFNTIPVAVAAMAVGPVGGAVAGGVFGLTSYLQAAQLINISPLLTVVLCFVPRIADGLICGFAARYMMKAGVKPAISGGVTGFLAACLNTLFFLPALVLLFGSTEYIQGIRETIAPGKGVFMFLVAFAGVNAVVEWIAVTAATSAIGTALSSARLIGVSKKKAEA
ncbi:MAG: ECF transporter S component [Ruminococcus sp.]|nr:ECF transporter S component [Ruminococcus sp.]